MLVHKHQELVHNCILWCQSRLTELSFYQYYKENLKTIIYGIVLEDYFLSFFFKSQILSVPNFIFTKPQVKIVFIVIILSIVWNDLIFSASDQVLYIVFLLTPSVPCN